MTTNDLDREEFDELIESIAPSVLSCLVQRSFFEKLEARIFADGPESPALCHHDFEVSKELLTGDGFSEQDQRDIYAVLASRGGCCCDCEILYNAAPNGCAASRAYWEARAAKIDETAK